MEGIESKCFSFIFPEISTCVFITIDLVIDSNSLSNCGVHSGKKISEILLVIDKPRQAGADMELDSSKQSYFWQMLANLSNAVDVGHCGKASVLIIMKDIAKECLKLLTAAQTRHTKTYYCV